MLRAHATFSDESCELTSLAPESLIEALGQGELMESPDTENTWIYGRDLEEPDWIICLC